MWAYQKPMRTGDYKRVFDLEMAARFIISKMEQRGARVDLDYSREKYESHHLRPPIEDWAKDGSGSTWAPPSSSPRCSSDFGRRSPSPPRPGCRRSTSTCSRSSPTPTTATARRAVIADQTLEMRRARKYASTYFANFLAKADANSMIHADIRTLAARTVADEDQQAAAAADPEARRLVRTAFIAARGPQADPGRLSPDRDAAAGALLRGPRPAGRRSCEADATGGDFFVIMGREIYVDPASRSPTSAAAWSRTPCTARRTAPGIEKMAESAGVPYGQMEPVVQAVDARYPGIKRFMK